MALIDYKCGKCGNSFFKIVYSEEHKVLCPKCGNVVDRIYKGKYYGKNGGGCGGGCSNCGVCH